MTIIDLTEASGDAAPAPESHAAPGSAAWAAIDVWLDAVAANSPNGSPQTIKTYWYHLAKLRWY